MASPGTFPNNSGLPQIPAGARQIPQSYLNHIGRELDRARQAPNSGQVSMQTPGGSNIDFSSIVAQLVSGFYRPLPFEVSLVSVGSNFLQVNIAEGRIFGRTNWSDKIQPIETMPYPAVSIGGSGFNKTYSGPFSDAGSTKPEPVDNPKANNTSTPNSNGDSGSVTNGADPSSRSDRNRVPNTNLPNGGKGSYYANNSKYPSGNAGSITGDTGSTFHTARPSGNADSVTGNKGNTYHSTITHTPLTVYKE